MFMFYLLQQSMKTLLSSAYLQCEFGTLKRHRIQMKIIIFVRVSFDNNNLFPTLSVLTLFPHYEKHAYSNILKILQPNKENFQIKNSDIFHIPAKNIDCGYSLEPQKVLAK